MALLSIILIKQRISGLARIRAVSRVTSQME
jgi:hypothetical protein